MTGKSFFVSLLPLLSFVAIPGCEREPGGLDAGPRTAPLPRHPAMNAPPSGTQTSQSPQALPPGHPAVPPAAPAFQGGQAPEGESAAPQQGTAGESGREVDAGPVTLTAPEDWVRQAPRQMTLAVFLLPRAEGDLEDGDMAVSAAGGSVEANIERWRSQFKESPRPVKGEAFAGGFRVTTAVLDGTYAGRSGEKPGFRMWGAIVEIPGENQLVFIKATGPVKTLGRWEKSFGDFLNSLKRSKG